MQQIPRNTVAFHVVGIGDVAHIENRPAGPRPKGGVRGETRCGVAFVPRPSLRVSRDQKVWIKCRQTCEQCWRLEMRTIPWSDGKDGE